MINYDVVFSDLYQFMKKNDFKGYDPYDFLSSPYVNKNHRSLSITGTQFLKYFPINIRPLLKIEKKHNLKTLVLTVRAIIKHFQTNNRDKKMEDDLNHILDIILSHSKNDCGRSWSRIDYDFFSVSGLQEKSSSIIYLTSMIGLMFIELYQYYGEKKYLDIADEIGQFLLKTEKYKHKDMICFYYTTKIKDRIYNASASSSAFLTMLFHYTNNDEYIDLAEKGFNYIVNCQNRDGSWYYGISSKGKLLKLIDYHQGFILDSIKYYITYIGFSEKFNAALKKGLNFYKNYQFLPSGVSIYRYPTKWPVDIHNQAQGIITFSKMGDIDQMYPEFAKKILDWTIKNMYNQKGDFFHYQKWPIFTNKIPYMRWGQAWMMLALKSLNGDFYKKECVSK